MNDDECLRCLWSNLVKDAYPNEDQEADFKHDLFHTLVMAEEETVRQEHDHSELRQELVKRGCQTWSVDASTANVAVAQRFYSKLLRRFKVDADIEKEEKPAPIPDDVEPPKKKQRKRARKVKQQGVNVMQVWLSEVGRGGRTMRECWQAFGELSADEKKKYAESAKRARDTKARDGETPAQRLRRRNADIKRSDREARAICDRVLAEERSEDADDEDGEVAVSSGTAIGAVSSAMVLRDHQGDAPSMQLLYALRRELRAEAKVARDLEEARTKTVKEFMTHSEEGRQVVESLVHHAPSLEDKNAELAPDPPSRCAGAHSIVEWVPLDVVKKQRD